MLFAALDEVMDYAAEKGLYVMLTPEMHTMIPEWWLAEYGFPQTPSDTNARCDFCETDSFGVRYKNPSIGSDIAQRDFGEFVEAVVTRYRDHPALVAWGFAIGPTGETAFGPSYIVLRDLGEDPPNACRLADYSPYARREFRSWIRQKYESDEDLALAWLDPSVSIDTVSITEPEAIFKACASSPCGPTQCIAPPFPEDTLRDIVSSLDELTQRGLDFYEFRTSMMNRDVDYSPDAGCACDAIDPTDRYMGNTVAELIAAFAVDEYAICQ